MKLACYFPTEEHPSFVVAEVDSRAYVKKLQEAVYHELKLDGHDVQLRDLVLYKADIPLRPDEDLQKRALQWLHEQPPQANLPLPLTLDAYYPSAPPSDVIHILIADPLVMEMSDGVGDPDFVYTRRVRKGLETSMRSLSLEMPPSELVKTSKAVAAFLDPNSRRVYIDRVPVAMFSPPLARLQQRLDNLGEMAVSPHEVHRAIRLLEVLNRSYESENVRQRAARPSIDSMVREPGTWQGSLEWAGGIKPDAIWFYGKFAIIISELKNTVGIDGDASFQAIADYSKIISCGKFKDFLGACNFPCVLIGLTGHRIQVSAAICLGTIYVSSMHSLDLSSGFQASQNIVQLGRIFKAVSLCREELQTYYDGVLPSRDTSSKLAGLFPNPTFALDVAPPSLVYRKFMARTGQPTSDLPGIGNMMTAMYIATLSDTDQEVIVKFAPRYNKEAHGLLADAGFAPKLYFCEQIIGGLYMVVMERVKGTMVWELSKRKLDIPAAVAQGVEKAISVLHNKDIVFGDLQDTNVIYERTDGLAEGKVYLVDFDWAEKHGEGLYPVTLNADRQWEDSVWPHGIMRKAHDLWQVERIKKLCA